MTGLAPQRRFTNLANRGQLRILEVDDPTAGSIYGGKFGRCKTMYNPEAELVNRNRLFFVSNSALIIRGTNRKKED